MGLVNKYAAVLHAHRLRADDRGARDDADVEPLGRVWWSAYPLLVFFVIVVTGNHFWFDAAAAVACIAAVAARQLARVRPGHKAWRESPATTTA